MANQVPAIEAAGILRLLVEKGLVTRGEAAACLRGIANDLVAYGQLGSLGDAGRAYAANLLEQAERLVAADARQAQGGDDGKSTQPSEGARPRLIWQS